MVKKAIRVMKSQNTDGHIFNMDGAGIKYYLKGINKIP